MFLTFGISLLFTAVLLAGIYAIMKSQTDRSASYRIFLILFFSVWSAALWSKTYQPTAGLLIISLSLVAAVFVLVWIPRRPPQNREQTKALLGQLQTERKLGRFFQNRANPFYWSILWCLIWSVCFRLVSLYNHGLAPL